MLTSRHKESPNVHKHVLAKEIKDNICRTKVSGRTSMNAHHDPLGNKVYPQAKNKEKMFSFP